MSFDLYFCRREQSDVTVDELREWIARHEHFTEHEYEGTYKFDYENEDTGVYFSITHGFPDWLPGSSREEGELPRFTGGVFPVSMDVRINVSRPSYFAHEAMPLMVDLARFLDLLMGNPQDKRDAPEGEPFVSYIGWVQPSDGEAGEAATVNDDDDEGSAVIPAWENGNAPPRFPEFDMIPRLYTSEELIHDWERFNTWSVYNMRRLANERGQDLPPEFDSVVSRKSSLRVWRYMREFRALEQKYENLFVPEAHFVKRPDSNRVVTAAQWPGPCGAILPPVDYFIIVREDGSGDEDTATAFLIKAERVLEIIDPFIKDFLEPSGAALVSEEKMLEEPVEGGFLEMAHDFHKSVEFAPEDVDFVDAGKTNFTDVAYLPGPDATGKVMSKEE
ncbi:MAG: hypothetical protein V3U93_04085 [Alphaproteobacteria bacterium]